MLGPLSAAGTGSLAWLAVSLAVSLACSSLVFNYSWSLQASRHDSVLSGALVTRFSRPQGQVELHTFHLLLQGGVLSLQTQKFSVDGTGGRV